MTVKVNFIVYIEPSLTMALDGLNQLNKVCLKVKEKFHDWAWPYRLYQNLTSTLNYSVL